MFTKTSFIFDGVKSDQFKLVLVNLQTGATNAPFTGSRSVVEEKMSKNRTPYFNYIKEEPMTITVTMARKEPWDYDTRIRVAQWLFQDEYKDLISTDHVGIVYKCIAVDSPEKILIGNIPRMLNITFRCNSSTAWSPLNTEYRDLTNITAPTIIVLENKSNIEKFYYPELTIRSIDGGTILIRNMTDEGRIFNFDNLSPNETLYVNNKMRQIETDRPSVYRLKDFNRGWLRLVQGVNQLEVSGRCEIKATMRFPMVV